MRDRRYILYRGIVLIIFYIMYTAVLVICSFIVDEVFGLYYNIIIYALQPKWEELTICTLDLSNARGRGAVST